MRTKSGRLCLSLCISHWVFLVTLRLIKWIIWIQCSENELFVTVLRYLQELALETLLSNCIFKCLYRVIRGLAKIFQRRGHRGYSPDCHVDLHAVHVLLNVTKTNFKKVGFSTMAFTAKNIVGCLLKRRPTKGGHRHPRTRP